MLLYSSLYWAVSYFFVLKVYKFLPLPQSYYSEKQFMVEDSIKWLNISPSPITPNQL